MVKGLYTAHTGMVNEMKRMDVLANNLANSDTYGFKKEGTTSHSFKNELAIKIKDTSNYGLHKNLGSMTYGVHLGETYTDWDEGSFKVTDNPTDLAIGGKGFFAIAFNAPAFIIRNCKKKLSLFSGIIVSFNIAILHYVREKIIFLKKFYYTPKFLHIQIIKHASDSTCLS